MVQSGVHYGLRARAAYKPRRQQAALSSDDQHAPGAAATVAAGFRPGVLTRPELLRFAGVQHDYLRARHVPSLPVLEPVLLKASTPVNLKRDDQTACLCIAAECAFTFSMSLISLLLQECYTGEMGRKCRAALDPAELHR